MRLRLIFVAFLSAAPYSAQPATQNLQALHLQVTDVRYWSLPGTTRVAIETSGEFHFKSDHIPNPERLFFDIVGAKPGLALRDASHKIQVKSVHDQFLRRIRIAENVPGVTRVVLDLQDNVSFTASQLSSPDRLIVELRASGSQPSPVPMETFAPVTTTAVTMETPGSIEIAPKIPPTLKNPVTVVENPAAAALKPIALPPAPSPALVAKTTPAVPSALSSLEPPPASPSRRISQDGSRSLVRALGLKINRIVIDPGHGGHDQGTSGEGGVLEKDLVLDVAQRLGKLVEERMGSEVVFTRQDDTYIGLRERTALANQRKADLFLSIHANSSPAKRVSGIETYYLNFTSSAEALDVAARENSSVQNSVYELKDLVQSIAQHDKIEESREFAQNMQTSLQAFESKFSPAAKDRGIRKAPFVVLIGAQMPSVLAEIGFLSNRQEESLLAKPDHRQKLAEALYRGLSRYAQSLSHFELTKRE